MTLRGRRRDRARGSRAEGVRRGGDRGVSGARRRRRARLLLSARSERARSGARRRRQDRARRRSGAARRRARRAQGPLRHQGRRDHRGQQDPRGLGAALRRHAVEAAEGGRRGARRQADDGRVRHGLVERELGVRPGAQSVGSRARARRLVGRIGGGGRGRAVSPARSAPTPADRSASRRRCAGSPGSSRPTAASRATASSRSPRRSIKWARSAAPARRARICSKRSPATIRTTPLARSPRAELSRRLRAAARAGCASASPTSTSPGMDKPIARWCLRRRRARCCSARSPLPSRCRTPSTASPPTTSSPPPRRRRTWRATTASATACASPTTTSDAMYARDARRRLRRRGQAPHHARHLRAALRLLRRLLRARAEGPHAHQARLRRRRSPGATSSLTPTSPTPAFKLGEKVADPLQMYLADVYTSRRTWPACRRCRCRAASSTGCRSACSSSAAARRGDAVRRRRRLPARAPTGTTQEAVAR